MRNDARSAGTAEPIEGPTHGPLRDARRPSVLEHATSSPRESFITVYGRKPVLEVLADRGLEVDKVLLADGSRGSAVEEIRALARARGVPVQLASAARVKLLAGNGRQDQGAIADVVAPRMRGLAAYLESGSRGCLVLLDGVTTPANVGQILRSATAAGVDGIVVPFRGVASLDPLVVKASAGIAFRAPVLRDRTAEDAARRCRAAGLELVGTRAGAGAASLFAARLPRDVVLVVGGESAGVSAGVAALVDSWVTIPMAASVESLNVANAAAVFCFEWARQRSLDGAGDAR